MVLNFLYFCCIPRFCMDRAFPIICQGIFFKFHFLVDPLIFSSMLFEHVIDFSSFLWLISSSVPL